MLVGVAALVTVGWLVVGQARRDASADAATDAAGRAALARAAADTVAGAPAAVNDFLRFAADPDAPASAGISHDYAADGLRRLADALAAMADDRRAADTVLQARIESVRRRADALQRARRWSEHTRDAREAFLTADDVLTALEGRAAAPEARDLVAARDAAHRMDLGLDPIAQVDRIERSFSATAVVVRRLAVATPPRDGGR
jgi:hypothetical protein